MKSLRIHFDNDEVRQTMKSLNYLDNNIFTETETLLNEQRPNWKEKGMAIVARNIVTRIIEKSGLVFDDELPLQVLGQDNLTSAYKELLKKSDFHDIAVNLDRVVRLIRTAFLLIQKVGDNYYFDVLHRGNAHIEYDSITKEPILLVHRIDKENFRVWTSTEINDYIEEDQKEPVLKHTEKNPLGIIPVAVFHDTISPRNRTHNFVPRDLIQLNERLNLHIIETEFLGSWAINQTLFTNVELSGTHPDQNYEILQRKQSTSTPEPNKIVGGPDAVIYMDTSGVD